MGNPPERFGAKRTMSPLIVLALLAPQTGLVAKKAGWWDVAVAYPRFTAGGPVARAANAASAARERKVFAGFVADAKREMPDIKKQGSPGSYQLDTTPHKTADNRAVCSGYVERYDYLAGAHGTTGYEVLNYAVLRGWAQAFTLKDVFRRGEDAVGQTSRALKSIILAGKDAPSGVASGDWKGLTEAESHRFVVGRLGLLFLFNQYDLGAGAEGPRQYLVPYAKLPGIDRKGILKGLIP